MNIQTDHRGAGQSAVIRTVVDSINPPQLKQPNLIRLNTVFRLMSAGEFILVAASTYLASILYHDVYFGSLPAANEYIAAALFIAASFTILSFGFRHFNMAQRQQVHLHLWSGIGAVALSFIIFLTTIFLLKISTDFSRGAFIFQIVGVAVSVCIFRAFSHLWLRSAFASCKIEARRAIMIGDANHYSTVADELKVGGTRVIDSIPFPRSPPTSNVPGDDRAFAINVNIREIVDRCRAMLPDDVVILASRQNLTDASELAHYLSTLPCDIHISPINDVKFIARSQLVDVGSVRTLRISRRPLSLTELAIKRTFDIVVATMAIIALSPLLLTVAIAIRLDSPGTVIFRQLRHGYNNKVIRIFKFRTMATTEERDHKFSPTEENDGRITLLGRILRRTNIDELPQLFNVLFGEMSIVGPRPHATNHNKLFEDRILPFARRHNVKPGITGWAQVNGYRGPANTLEVMQRRVDFDLYYIDNWSFFFDLKIILMTLFSKKAYVNAF